MLFKDLNLDAKLLQAVEASGFSEPTEIQSKAIPVVLAGRDLMASAQTGTGKTAAFVLPALQQLLKPSEKKGKGPRVLVLTPTRELAMQVNDNIRQFSKFVKFTNGTVVGGMPYPPQMKMLRNPLDLLVATPGRLMDHMEQGRVDFSRLEVLILDEADRMLDMGFVDAVKMIAAATPGDRQTLLFSATLEGRVLKIAQQLLKNPEQISLAVNNERHKSIEQHVHHADSVNHKHDLLDHHLRNADMTQAVIFTATKRAADKLAKSLMAQGHKSAALHGDMSQNKRKRTVENMRHGKFRLLVATDVAARGLDIKGISHVINFDMPMVAEDYIHRIGRTGRAGAKGNAISLIGPGDWDKLSAVERLTGQKLKREVVEGMEPTTAEPRGGRRPGGGGFKPKGKSYGKPRGGSQQRNGGQPRNGSGNSRSNDERRAAPKDGKPGKPKFGKGKARPAGKTTGSNKKRSGSRQARQHFPSGPMLG
ncbi:MAG: DEAD/DEAH box helicase [Acidiferrobacterales bacterium]|nr:DEAD/DEAH box helicase [Acidiferrobacterales bacterium]